MVPVCQQCGEELLGNVNRCWKCGTTVRTANPLPPAMPGPPVTAYGGPAWQGQPPSNVPPVAPTQFAAETTPNPPAPVEPIPADNSPGVQHADEVGSKLNEESSVDRPVAAELSTSDMDSPIEAEIVDEPVVSADVDKSETKPAASDLRTSEATESNDILMADVVYRTSVQPGARPTGEAGSTGTTSPPGYPPQGAPAANATPQSNPPFPATVGMTVPPVQPAQRYGSPFAQGPSVAVLGQSRPIHSGPIPRYENVSAKGGAVGAMVLGVMAIFGSLLTAASFITAFLGLGMGLWGLMSTKRKMAILGMVLCVIAMFICAGRVVLAIRHEIQMNQPSGVVELETP